MVDEWMQDRPRPWRICHDHVGTDIAQIQGVDRLNVVALWLDVAGPLIGVRPPSNDRSKFRYQRMVQRIGFRPVIGEEEAISLREVCDTCPLESSRSLTYDPLCANQTD